MQCGEFSNDSYNAFNLQNKYWYISGPGQKPDFMHGRARNKGLNAMHVNCMVLCLLMQRLKFQTLFSFYTTNLSTVFYCFVNATEEIIPDVYSECTFFMNSNGQKDVARDTAIYLNRHKDDSFTCSVLTTKQLYTISARLDVYDQRLTKKKVIASIFKGWTLEGRLSYELILSSHL